MYFNRKIVMQDNKIIIDFGADSSFVELVKLSETLKKNINEAYENSQKLGNDYDIDQLEKYIKEAEKYNKAVFEQAKKERELAKALEEYRLAQEKANETTNEATNELTKLSAKIVELQKSNALLKKSNKDNTDEFTNNKLQIKELQKEYTKLQSEQLKTKNTTELLTKFLNTQDLSMKELQELSSGLTIQYNKLTESERLNSVEGQKLTAQLSLISQKLKEGDEAVGKFQRSVGDYKTAITKSETELSNLILKQNQLKTSNQTNTQEFKDLNLAIVQTVGKITKYKAQVELVEAETKRLTLTNNSSSVSFKDLFSSFTLAGLAQTAIQKVGQGLQFLNQQIDIINTQQTKLKSTLGLTGEELDLATVKIRTLTDVYKDLNSEELTTSLNAVSKAFGEDFNTVIAGFEEGLKKGSNASGEFLSILTESSARVADSGISLEQYYAIINQAVSEGTYSDKGVQLIAEGAQRLREYTQATKDALSPLSESVKLQIEQSIASGNSFEALQLVSNELNTAGLTAQQTQTIIADVFGPDAEDAGIKFTKTIGNVKLSLDDVADTTTDLTKAQLKFYDSWETLLVGLASSDGEFAKLKANFFDLAANLLTAVQTSESLQLVLQDIIAPFQNIFDILEPIFKLFSDGNDDVSFFEGLLTLLSATTRTALIPLNLLTSAWSYLFDIFKEGLLFINDVIFAFGEVGKELGIINEEIEVLAQGLVESNSKFNKRVLKNVKETTKATTDLIVETVTEELGLVGEIIKRETDTFDVPALASKSADEIISVFEEAKKNYKPQKSKDFIDLFIESLGLDSETKALIKSSYEELQSAYFSYRESVINNNIESLERQKDDLQVFIDIENEKLNVLNGNLETQKDLWDKEQENDYLRTQSEIQLSEQRIAQKELESKRLTELQEQENEKLKQIQKRAIQAKFALDFASAISSAIKYSAENPLNSITAGIAGFTQYALMLTQITTNFLTARAAIKNLAKGEVRLKGSRRGVDDIPALLAHDESVVTARGTDLLENTLRSANKPNVNRDELLEAFKTDFGQDVFANNVIDMNFNSLELKKQVENQNRQIEQQAMTINVLKNMLQSIENKIDRVPIGDYYEFQKNTKRQIIHK